MKHEITLTGFTIDPGGALQVDYDWNGSALSRLYNTELDLQNVNADILQDPEDVIRWLMYYLLQLGHTAATMSTAVGRKLVVDIGPAVQQSISLV